MNALTQANGSAPAANSNPYAEAGRGAGNATFMKFVGQSGDFLYGQDDEEMPHGTRLAAQVSYARYSWAFWWDGKVLETIEVDVIEDPRAFEHEPDHLPDDYDDDMTLEEIRAERKDKDKNFMDGWSCQGIIGLRALDGDLEEYTLKLNAGVAMSAFQTLLGAYGRVFRMKEGKTPIIELGARKYKSKIKNVGTRYAPSLKIVDWLSDEDLMDAANAGEDPADYADEPDGADTPAIENKAAEDQPRRRGARGARGANLG